MMETSLEPANPALDDRSIGFFLGILTGEGSCGGDGRQPQITIRMHTRHERLFRWLTHALPGSTLYGPYHHSGRSYFQWMVRGPYLREVVAPLIAQHRDLLDDHTASRFFAMCERYAIRLPDGTGPS